MFAQPAYLSSIFVSFSTFLSQRGVFDRAAHEATLALAAVVEHKTDWTLWNLERLAEFWQSPIGASHQSSAQALVTAFIKSYPPTQTNVFLHEFCLALKSNGCSYSTIKNYRSDIGQFAQFGAETELTKLITKPKVILFLRQQLGAGLKHSSIRRKLVSIQQFANWAANQSIMVQPQWFPELFASLESAQPLEVLDPDPNRPKPALSPKQPVSTIAAVPIRVSSNLGPVDATSVPVPSPLAHQERTAQLQSVFSRVARKHLRRSNHVSGNSGQLALTVLVLLVMFVGIGFFGYQQLLLRVASPLAYPTSPTRPNRQLSFQGRLTDTAQNPITTATDMRFYLYDTGPATGSGTELWDSGTCSVTPDQDGIFSAALGDDCGSEITEDVFSENSNVWLEVEIETETLDPRQAIQTVPYALNSETLQGYPIAASGAATVNTVVTMNSGGEIVLGEVSPTIRSVSGTFSLEAQTLSLETSSGSNGDIILSPDGTGQVEVNADTVIDGYLYAPGATLSATYAGGTALVARGGPSGTANIQEWQNSSSTPLSVVTSAGNLGIGTTSSSSRLDVTSSALNTDVQRWMASDGSRLGRFTETSGGHGWFEVDNSSGTAAVLFRADGGNNYVNTGNLGIGTTSPTTQLHVYSTAPNLRLESGSANNISIALVNSSYNSSILQRSTGQLDISNQSNEPIRFAGSGSSWMDMTSDGLTINAQRDLRLADSDSSHYLALQAPATVSSSITYTLPGTLTNGYVLSTDGSGTLSWSDPAVLAGGTNLWDTTNGALYPKNATLDLLIGGTATSSAKFAFINNNSGNPTATISGNLALAVPTGADPAATLDVFNGGSLNVRTSVGGSAGATSRLFIANGGNVGIGTTSPSVQFEVRRGASTTAPKLYLAADGGNENDYVTELSFVKDTTEISSLYRVANSYGLTLTNRGSITLDANAQGAGTGSEGHILLQPDANVGIGTTTPGGKLQINGGSTGVKSLLVRGNTSDDANIQEWQLNAGTNQMYVNQYGELYLGPGASRDTTMTPRQYIGKAESSDISYSAASETVIQVTGAASGVYGNAFYAYINPATSKTVAESHGMFTQVSKGGAGNVTELTAYNARLAAGTGGTLSNLYGFNIDYSFNNGAAITNLYGLHVPTMTVSSGTLTNQYGIYLDALNTATNNYAIVTNAGNIVFNEGGDSSTDFRVEGDADANLLFVDASADNVGIGTSAPGQQLDVAGEIELANYLYFGNGSSNYLRWDATNFQLSNSLLPATDATYSLGTDSNRWQDLYLSGSSLHMGTSGDEAILGYNTASDYLSFDPDADTVAEVVITDTGNLGIGSLTPAAALDVVGDVHISSGLSLFNTAVSDDTIEATTFCTGDGESNCVSDFSILSAGSIWSSANGAIYPKNSTMDLLLGATATTSAKFAFTNVNSGTPTATMSAGVAGGTYLNSQGKLAATAMQNLTLGDSTTTGDIIINPNRNVGIGTTAPSSKLHIYGGGSGAKTLQVRGNSSNDANIQEWQNGSGTALSVVDEAGWIGIGTSNPSAPLNVGTSAGNSSTGAVSIGYVSSYTGGST
ncbi:phage integrase N-terminal SAM-like domain-containing protein, partial [Candidatus Woesebacteria bacterium]|nr:phage integrase N-terminal SAM-like domain-containing protein [Candidatus Woesebacteria bacterium]